MMKSFLVGAALIASAAGTSAQVYMGGSVGWARISTDCESGFKCDDKSAGYRVHVGYDDTAKIAGELGYLSFGSPKFEGFGDSGKFKVHAVTLGFAFRNELMSGLKGVLRVGTAYTTVKRTSNLFITEESSGLNPHVGLGLEFDVAPNMQAMGAFDMTRGSTDSGNKGNLYLLSAGVQYHF